MSELERKGLGVHQLLQMEFPGDLTIAECREAVKKSDAFLAIVGVSKFPERVDVRFGWRWPNGDEQWAPDDITLDAWKSYGDREVFISISDSEGGVGAKQPEPELV